MFTTLNRRVMPLVRYCSNDVSTISPAVHGCASRSLSVLGEVEGRTDTAILMKCGFSLTPTSFHDGILSCEDAVDYKVSYLPASSQHPDELSFAIEVKGPCSSALQQALVERIRNTCDDLGISQFTIGNVTLCPTGSLRPSGREKRLVNLMSSSEQG